MNISTTQTLLDWARSSVISDCTAVEQVIKKTLQSSAPLANCITQYLSQNSGKRARALTLLLAAKACAPSEAISADCHRMGAVLEHIHTATLLHDDVIDQSSERRQQPTTHVIWNNSAAILSGDFLYARAFSLLAELHQTALMRCLSKATEATVEGEIEQLTQQGNANLSLTQYTQIITNKTAQLFSAAAECGAIISNRPDYQAPLASFGLQLGMIFQMADDWLDYDSNAQLGKATGDDCAEGKMTLPTVLLMQCLDAESAEHLRNIIQKRDRSQLPQLQRWFAEYNIIEQCQQTTAELAQQAIAHLSILPASPAREGLINLLHFAHQRQG